MQSLRREAKATELAQLANAERSLHSNPLLAPTGAAAAVKRRWDDDVVFKNQAKDEKKLEKRFINDTIRSDFHRKFLAKYIH